MGKGTVWSVNTSSEIPEGPHWAIVTFGSIHIPGDERSRTNPGHGYPASTQTSLSYTVYTSEEEWKAEIESLAARRDKKFVALVAKRPVIRTHIVVEMD